MNDRELLELAAKAAGIPIDKSTTNGGGRAGRGFDMLGNVVTDWHNGTKWNPLTDDGDALRLAVKLHIDLTVNNGTATAVWVDMDLSETHECFEYCDEAFEGIEAKVAAARRAIVRAAAEIGRNIAGDGGGV